MLNRRLCDVCEGTGRTSPDSPNDPSGRTFACHNGCDDGYFDMVAADFDGLTIRYRHATGYAFVYHGALALEQDDGLLVVNLQPHLVEIVTCAS